MDSKSPSAVPVEIPTALNVMRKAVDDARLAFHVLLERVIAGGVPRDPGQLHDLERSLHQLVSRYCVDPVIGAVVQAAHVDTDVQTRASEAVADYPDLRLQKSDQAVRITLLGGSVVTVITPYFLVRPRHSPGKRGKKGQRGPEGNGVYPVLAVLGIHFRVSPALVGEVARLAARGTIQEAMDTMAARGVLLDSKVITRWAQRFAERGLAYRDWLQRRGQAVRQPESSAQGKRLVIGTDGGRLRTRVNNRAGRRRSSGRRGFKGAWREPKVLVVYEVDEKGRKLQRGLLWYDATLENADRLFEILATILIGIGAAEAKEWVIVGDGADWIWDRVANLVKKVGFDPEKVTDVVDFYHAAEHIREVASAVTGWTHAEQEAWYYRVRRHLYQGNTDRVIEEIEALCIGRKAKEMRKFTTYFKKHAHRMSYRVFRRSSIPTGSGAVESGVRRLVNLRFKGNGIFWTVGNAEGLLHLRAQLLAGRWDHFTRAILQPEPRWASTVERAAPQELQGEEEAA